ncbi:MAG TPA: Uma2 family endonuclease [Gemmata sp.]
MSTAALAPIVLVRNGIRLLTLADVAMLPSRLASGDVRYELHNGNLVVMSPPGGVHGRLQLKFGRYLSTEGEEKGLGEAFAEVGIILRRYPDHLVGADAAFVSAAQLPVLMSPEGYLTTIPELVIEIRSKNDSQPEVDAKVRDYLAAGVVLVWVADPEARTVTAHQANRAPTVFAATDTLTALPVIPGFAVPVSDLLPV